MGKVDKKCKGEKTITLFEEITVVKDRHYKKNCATVARRGPVISLQIEGDLTLIFANFSPKIDFTLLYISSVKWYKFFW